MTSSLPPSVRDVFERFITTEYVTVDSRQRPIVWPVTPYYKQGAPTIDVTTGIGYPKKAEDARRNPRVALLFSDPTGSGIDSGVKVLVQGTAEVDDRDLAANRDRYRHESLEKLPATKDMLPPRILERMFSWYYERLYVRVRPERVFVWPDGDLENPPEVLDSHLEEVRSGRSEEPEQAHASREGGSKAWDERIEELGGRHETAVLGWVAPDGFPIAVRLPIELDRSQRRIVIGATPSGVPLAEGRACLTAHDHAPDFTWQENFQVRGDLVRDGDRWALVPHRLVGGFELPDESELARYRRNLGKSIRFYRTRKRLLKQRG
jgi:pyridoxamine 5'-phosphate oxidase-like protein